MLASAAVKTKLASYLDKHSISHREFAAKAGIAHLHPMVSLWARGMGAPGLDNALAIERATDGEVPATYWGTLRRRGCLRSRRTNH